MNKNVLEWLEATAARYPSKVAYESDQAALTFRDVENLSRRIGTAILNKKVPAGPIAVFLGKEPRTIAAFLGIVYSGRTYAPIDASLPAERIARILGVLQPALIITDSLNKDKIAKLSSTETTDINELINSEIDNPQLDAVRKAMVGTDPLYIIFTSGSSGVPKGVITSHLSLMCYITAYTEVMGIDQNDRIANQSPLDYIAAIRDIYVPLLTGAGTFLTDKKVFMQPAVLADIIQEREITSLGWSTSSLTLLASLGFLSSDKIQGIRKICFSGSVMSGAVLRKWQLALPDTRFVNQYGPTEATASCTCHVLDHIVSEDEIIPIGKAYNHYKVFIVREDGTEAADDEPGEIYVSGPILALGYYNDMKRTLQDFIQNPLHNHYTERTYKTGDIGVRRPDGCLEFHGRKDRQIKHMGHRVELDEIDSAVLTVPGIRECVTVYNTEKETICLFYCGNVSSKDLVIRLRQMLPGFMIPRKTVCLEELPKLPNGKTDMIRIKEMM